MANFTNFNKSPYRSRDPRYRPNYAVIAPDASNNNTNYARSSFGSGGDGGGARSSFGSGGDGGGARFGVGENIAGIHLFSAGMNEATAGLIPPQTCNRISKSWF